MSKPRLYKIDAYYKNDKPGGIGISLFDFAPDFGDNLIKFIDSYENEWKSANKKTRKEIIECYFNQLNQIAKAIAEGREKEIERHNALTVTNICFLEKHGFIKTDKYNGCIFQYESQMQENVTLIEVTEPFAPKKSSRSRKKKK